MKAILHGGPFDGCVATYDQPTHLIRVRHNDGHSVYSNEGGGGFRYRRDWRAKIQEAITTTGYTQPVSVSKEGTDA